MSNNTDNPTLSGLAGSGSPQAPCSPELAGLMGALDRMARRTRRYRDKATNDDVALYLTGSMSAIHKIRRLARQCLENAAAQ